MIEIPLTKGYVALVDDEDATLVLPFKWHASVCIRNGKPLVYAKRKDKGGRTIAMHNVVMGVTPPLPIVDHRDADNTLDNRRSNLRVSSNSFNGANSRKRSNTTSKYKGVSKVRRGGWRADIAVNNMRRCLGHFAIESDAARAYDKASFEAFGEFARNNKVQ